MTIRAMVPLALAVTHARAAPAGTATSSVSSEITLAEMLGWRVAAYPEFAPRATRTMSWSGELEVGLSVAGTFGPCAAIRLEVITDSSASNAGSTTCEVNQASVSVVVPPVNPGEIVVRAALDYGPGTRDVIEIAVATLTLGGN